LRRRAKFFVPHGIADEVEMFCDVCLGLELFQRIQLGNGVDMVEISGERDLVEKVIIIFTKQKEAAV